ncbi:MAG: class I SAM-dependent methyltransferase [Planctomycetota bacterium]|nr:class I SAM-dependent methyltransferase [Planctomycetota bacterium]
MDPLAYKQFLELDRSHWWMRGRRTVYLGLIEHFLRDKKPKRILDLGAGIGGFLEGLDEIRSKGGRVFPADIDAESLGHIAARGFPGGVIADGYALPYRNGSFDLICLFDAIEHTEDDLAVMVEIERVLAPGGHLFVSVPAYQFLFANNDRVARHFRRYRRGRLNDLFGRAGLSVVRNTHANIFLFPLILPVVLVIKALEKALKMKADPSHTNLTWPMPKFVHSLLAGIFSAELPFSRRFGWPVGHSICALAKKSESTH